MTFWIIAALLTFGACMAILIPATRRAGPAAGSDVEVYRDQLEELGRDTARGLIGVVEADEARTEIARRILKSAREGQADAPASSERLGRWLTAAAVIAVPLASWTIYAAIGSPDRPSEPLEARLAADPAKSTIEELVARAEARLAANPDDGRGWDVLAPVYLRGGRYAEAVEAYRRTIRLNGSSAERETGLGEALAAAAGGRVGPEAVAAFERGLSGGKDNLKARFFLAAAKAQGGHSEEAKDAWTAMLAELPADSEWRAPISQAIAETSARTAASSAGPTATEVAAASSMTAADRGAMIGSMVARLAERLRANPNDPEGWRKLIRSYVVLGKSEEARNALKQARLALGAKAGMADFAASVGLPEAN